jgi:hypothetical protein
MKLIVTIDAEADVWGSSGTVEDTVHNIEYLPELQTILEGYGVRPTYLVDFPVASQKRSVEMLRHFVQEGRCELGTHCHPWSTPPFEEDHSKRNTMLCNLPPRLQLRKLTCLHETIIKNFGTTPASFRAGRWGYSQEVAKCLDILGYTVDSSITPLTDWRSSFGPDFSRVGPQPYYFTPDRFLAHISTGSILEVPATVGYTRTTNSAFLSHVTTFLNSPLATRLRLMGLPSRLRLVNKVWLSPEMCSTMQMIALTRSLLRQGQPVINLFFHSTTLQPGLTPYVGTEADKQVFLSRLHAFLAFVREQGIEPITLAEAVSVVPRRRDEVAGVP